MKHLAVVGILCLFSLHLKAQNNNALVGKWKITELKTKSGSFKNYKTGKLMISESLLKELTGQKDSAMLIDMNIGLWEEFKVYQMSFTADGQYEEVLDKPIKGTFSTTKDVLTTVSKNKFGRDMKSQYQYVIKDKVLSIQNVEPSKDPLTFYLEKVE